MHSPRLIILDEPTSGLDPLMQKTFFELIRRENKNGATVLFSSHILSEVQRLCDRVAIIKDGRIVKIQDMAELRNDACKKVTVSLSEGSLDAAELSGAVNFNKHGDEFSFLYKGDCGQLLKILSDKKVINIDIGEPALEEIFLHYYA
ncbi:hypothetical protein SDC9_192345 [bioreactor metagenome]|uniref:ATPase AAA-type core domain-containing protein n=1 Tax=bioreactor metagenome TaxID=1076179 RepID=A0A645I0V2_9ZZZZ